MKIARIAMRKNSKLAGRPTPRISLTVFLSHENAVYEIVT